MKIFNKNKVHLYYFRNFCYAPKSLLFSHKFWLIYLLIYFLLLFLFFFCFSVECQKRWKMWCKRTKKFFLVQLQRKRIAKMKKKKNEWAGSVTAASSKTFRAPRFSEVGNKSPQGWCVLCSEYACLELKRSAACHHQKVNSTNEEPFCENLFAMSIKEVQQTAA